MPYLFCKQHGKEHVARSKEEQDNYRLLGETVLIVRGTLISGPWRCDRCNAPLKRRQKAWLVTAFPRHFAEDLEAYDYAYERQYFRIDKAEVKVYGADPPGGIPSLATVAEAG
jgi:hypothetical protein